MKHSIKKAERHLPFRFVFSTSQLIQNLSFLSKFERTVGI